MLVVLIAAGTNILQRVPWCYTQQEGDGVDVSRVACMVYGM